MTEKKGFGDDASYQIASPRCFAFAKQNGGGRNDRCNKGFILLLTLALMTSLSAVVGALLLALTTDLRSTAIQANDAKAFWLAEAGLADGWSRAKREEIILNEGDRDNRTIRNVRLGDGTYSVAFSRIGNDITITSTGTASNQFRTVEATYQIRDGFPPAFNYALWGANLNNVILSITGNTVINGNVFYNAREEADQVVVYRLAEVINGLVYADSISGRGTYTRATGPPDPIPTWPYFNTSYYDTELANADRNPRSSLILGTGGNLALAGQTLYFDDVSLWDNARVTGPGTIVTRGSVTMVHEVRIGEGVHIIARSGITILGHTIVERNGSLYSRGSINLLQWADVTSVLMGPHGVWLGQHATLNGIILTDTVSLSGYARVNGSVVTQMVGGGVIPQDVHINYDSSYLPARLPVGFKSYPQKENSWQEVT